MLLHTLTAVCLVAQMASGLAIPAYRLKALEAKHAPVISGERTPTAGEMDKLIGQHADRHWAHETKLQLMKGAAAGRQFTPPPPPPQLPAAGLPAAIVMPEVPQMAFAPPPVQVPEPVMLNFPPAPLAMPEHNSIAFAPAPAPAAPASNVHIGFGALDSGVGMDDNDNFFRK